MKSDSAPKIRKKSGKWGEPGLYEKDKFICSIEQIEPMARNLAQGALKNLKSCDDDLIHFEASAERFFPYNFMLLLKNPDDWKSTHRAFKELITLSETEIDAWDCLLFIAENKQRNNKPLIPPLTEWLIDNLSNRKKRPSGKGIETGNDKRNNLAARNYYVRMAIAFVNCNCGLPVYANGENAKDKITATQIVKEELESLQIYLGEQEIISIWKKQPVRMYSRSEFKIKLNPFEDD